MSRSLSPSDVRRKAARRERTVQAINVNADVRQKARDGHDVAGWRARCTCGWNEMKPNAHDALEAWRAHSKRFPNGYHDVLRALPELGEHDRKPHANTVQRLTGDLEVLFEDRRVETAGSLRVPFFGSTAHYREDR